MRADFQSVKAWTASAGGIAICLSLALAAGAPAAGQPHVLRSSGCSAEASRATWVAFVSAYTRGDFTRLDSLFAQRPRFQWYSANAPGVRRTAAARNRDTLMAYFRARHAEDDRLRLVSFTFNGNGNFTYRLRRSAGDYRHGAWFGLIGKAAVACSDSSAPQLIVVSLGGPGSDKP
jgi:hypothetical protein